MKSVYAPEAKRQKTESEKAADKERKLEKQALIASTDPTAEWSLGKTSYSLDHHASVKGLEDRMFLQCANPLILRKVCQ